MFPEYTAAVYAMPRNIEIKARISDTRAVEALAAALSDTAPELIEQEDTFFNVPRGRLKLRVFSPTKGELIFYERDDCAGPKCSLYSIVPTIDPSALKSLLSAALGVRAVVRKRRTLYLCGQTRIHLDDVEGLGDFLELEVVLTPEQRVEEGTAIASDLMRRLNIRPSDLVEGAYVDLLMRSSTARCGATGT